MLNLKKFAKAFHANLKSSYSYIKVQIATVLFTITDEDFKNFQILLWGVGRPTQPERQVCPLSQDKTWYS